MQLRMARLCLDCDEVHDEYRCPVCASDHFTYLTRWVPAPDRRDRSRPATPPSPDLDVYRQLISPQSTPQRGRFFTRALVGLGAASVMGIFLGGQRARAKHGENGVSSVDGDETGE